MKATMTRNYSHVRLIAIVALLVPRAHSQTQTCTVTPAERCTITDNDATCNHHDDHSEDYMTVSGCDNVICDNQYACKFATISDAENVECMNDATCLDATISNVANLQCTKPYSCVRTTILDVPANGLINCEDTDYIYGDTCDNMEVSSTNPFTLTCHRTYTEKEGEDPVCYGGSVENPGGSVFCSGGSSTAPMCKNIPITDTVGCLVCGNKDACKGLTIGTMDVPEDEIYVQPTCSANQVLSYLNTFHPEDGTACENNVGSNENYCDVVEAYCESNPDDINCMDEFQVVDGFWTKEEICTVTPANGNCAVNDNDVTCTGTGIDDYTIQDCKEITCTDQYSCHINTFSNSESIECNNKEACNYVTISSVTDVSCSGGDRACEYATISDISEGGYVDCGKAEEAYSYTCKDASFSSESSFTLTCAGTPGTSVLACANGHITNPEGSVFCYGGITGSGICHDITISESVGCVICGSNDACNDVILVDDDGTEVRSMRENQVAVYKNCEASDVVDFLNLVHPHGGTVSCQDDYGDGVCDVVEKYCARKTRDANCEEEFQVVNGTWTKEKIRATNDIDPDSLALGRSDKVGRESWIAGSAVIVVLLLATLAIVFYCGHKNQWAVLKQFCGGKSMDQEIGQASKQEQSNETNGIDSQNDAEENERVEHV